MAHGPILSLSLSLQPFFLFFFIFSLFRTFHSLYFLTLPDTFTTDTNPSTIPREERCVRSHLHDNIIHI
ncbi:hypothetical protein K457DRAFT_139982, partial [Linnemannia elongata AG-77]